MTGFGGGEGVLGAAFGEGGGGVFGDLPGSLGGGDLGVWFLNPTSRLSRTFVEGFLVRIGLFSFFVGVLGGDDFFLLSTDTGGVGELELDSSVET